MASKDWQKTPDDQLTAELITELLEDISDDLWVTAACAERIVNDAEVSQVLVKTGLRRSSRLIESIKGSLVSYEHIGDAEEPQDGQKEQLVSYFESHERERKLCILRRLLFDRLDRIQTYLLMSNAWKSSGTGEEEEAEEEEDPWADPDEDIPMPPVSDAPFTLAEFLVQPLVDSGIILASEQRFRALDLLINYHDQTIFPYRYSILDAIPLYVHPSEYHHLLPANDYDTSVEVRETRKPWREKVDWVEEREVVDAVNKTASKEEEAWLEGLETPEDEEFPRTRHDKLLTAEQLTAWYTARVASIDSQSGLLDNALIFLQHGASQSVPGLDELGEDLILLDRLIYEAPQPDTAMQIDWDLPRWRQMQPREVIRAYLAYSTYESIPSDIRSLVMPYLSVLEAQAERAKRPDLELATRLLYDYILEAPLELVVAIFEHSKADVQRSYRIIKTDEDVARVAMAYLYGLTKITDWPMLSRIFECQPDWGDEREDDDEAFATLTSLATFVAPSASRASATAQELLLFFKPLPASALSRLLDVLDTHLEGGEILSKWGVDTPLQWFLLSADNEAEQRSRAVRMSRRTVHQGAELEDEASWRTLFDDMIKLTSNGEGGVKPAFGRLSPAEISKIFFTGLLSSGNFAVAKRLKGRGNVAKYLTGPVVEEICLNVSRELYDNASSGNMHRGDMKLAYECLSVALPTARIQQERDFIEATSKICSFHVHTRPGQPITPLEIRLTKDRLDLIARVLSSTDDAYKHSDVILDLSQKLGYRGDGAAEVKILSMLVEVALQHEDFLKAEAICERMMESARSLRSAHSAASLKDELTSHSPSSAQEALDVAWRSCFQLGRQSEFSDTNGKLRLLGYALELCPTTNMLDVLSAWRRLEARDIESRKERSQARAATRAPGRRRGSAQQPAQRQSRAIAAAGSLLDGLKGLSQGQDAAANMLNRVAANFPFSMGARRGEMERSSSPRERNFGDLFSMGRRSDEIERSRSPRDRNLTEIFARQTGNNSPGLTEEVAAGARQALSRGVGWLLGGDDES